MASADRPDLVDTTPPPHTLTPALATAIDNAIIAASHGRKWLLDGHPPFTATLAEGLAAYGGLPEKNAGFDLWCLVRVVEAVRGEWEWR